MIFLGTLFKRDEERNIKAHSKAALANAANTFQWAMIDGLNQVLKTPVKIWNVLPVGTFPGAYDQWKLPTRKWSYEETECLEIGCLNFPVFKQHMRFKKLKKLLKNTEEREILIYGAYYPFLHAVENLDHSYRVTLIVTDLPEYYDYGEVSPLRRLLRRHLNLQIRRAMKRVDNFVLLTEQMKDSLDVGERPYIVVEGISDIDHIPQIKYHSEEKVILYTGTLNKKFGIQILLEAFSLIKDPSYRLWLCGAGDADSEIREMQKRDPRIHYYGYVTKAEAEELTNKATVLVNPRTNEGEYTKYSFPSKTMVYMASGVPVVMFKLDGIPDEYDPYLNYVEDPSPRALANVLEKICTMPQKEWMDMGMQAYQFISQQKNNVIQAQKVLKLMQR